MISLTKPPRLSRKAYDALVPRLREDLIQLQVALKNAPFKVLLILAGFEGAGRGEVINTLSGWLDPRGIETFALQDPTDEEKERPFMWRFWRSLPANGRIGIYAGSWYTEIFSEESFGQKSASELKHEVERIRHFEKLLADNGTLIVKIWLHLSKGDQRDRLHTLEGNPDTAWRVTPEHWYHYRNYDQIAQAATDVMKATHTPSSPWATIDASHARSRDIAVARTVLRLFKVHVGKIARSRTSAATPRNRSLAPQGLARLRALPLGQALSPEVYEKKREKWLGRLNLAVRNAQTAGRSIIFVFEGWDAAGKGGAIRRLTSAIDARYYRVIPVAKPTDEEKAHHYLWRFWRHVPRAGMVTIYDRSWYGRVLVERLEGFATAAEWRRAFSEINDFEEQLSDHGIIVVKFWLHVSKSEQLRRFRERENTPYKRHKINDEDWRNRRKWTGYETAVGDMLALTETSRAPWHLIPANDKRYARLEVLKTSVRQIEAALKKG